MLNQIINDDCLNIHPKIESKSIDLILTDLPYKVTNARNKMDRHLVDPVRLWADYERIIKDTGTIALHAMQPFASLLINSCMEFCKELEFRYEWIWEKSLGTNFLNAKKQPLRNHECILIFYKSPGTYNPQMREGKPYKMTRRGDSANYGEVKELHWTSESNGERYPLTVLKYNYDKEKIHPTQKPLALSEYLIKTYTNVGDTVLDSTMGSGTTICAAINLRRKYIGVEKDGDMFMKAKDRIQNVILSINQPVEIQRTLTD